MSQTVFSLFKKCVEAIREGVLIRQVSSTDKEFHFQNWFEDRLKETGFNYEIAGRNSYPDFRIVSVTEGYELKALEAMEISSFATEKCMLFQRLFDLLTGLPINIL